VAMRSGGCPQTPMSPPLTNPLTNPSDEPIRRTHLTNPSDEAGGHGLEHCNTRVGSPFYRAPEQVYCLPPYPTTYSTGVDVWSAGVVLLASMREAPSWWRHSWLAWLAWLAWSPAAGSPGSWPRYALGTLPQSCPGPDGRRPCGRASLPERPSLRLPPRRYVLLGANLPFNESAIPRPPFSPAFATTDTQPAKVRRDAHDPSPNPRQLDRRSPMNRACNPTAQRLQR